MTQDITDIERSAENKIEIESICKACDKFKSSETIDQEIKNADGDIEQYTVQLPIQICTQDGRYVIFQGLKKTDICPQGLW